MIAYPTTTSEAARICARIAELLGYPRAGIDAETGEVRTDGVGTTTLWVAPWPHPSDSARAAVPIDAVVRGIGDAEIMSVVALAAELTAEWLPANAP